MRFKIDFKGLGAESFSTGTFDGGEKLSCSSSSPVSDSAICCACPFFKPPSFRCVFFCTLFCALSALRRSFLPDGALRPRPPRPRSTSPRFDQNHIRTIGMNERTSELAQKFFGQFGAVKMLVTHCEFHGVILEKLFSTDSGGAFDPRNPTLLRPRHSPEFPPNSYKRHKNPLKQLIRNDKAPLQSILTMAKEHLSNEEVLSYIYQLITAQLTLMNSSSPNSPNSSILTEQNYTAQSS